MRRKACKVLEEVGGKDTLKAMDAMPKDPDFATQVAAAAAYKQIVARVGPVSSSRAGKTATPSRGRR